MRMGVLIACLSCTCVLALVSGCGAAPTPVSPATQAAPTEASGTATPAAATEVPATVTNAAVQTSTETAEEPTPSQPPPTEEVQQPVVDGQALLQERCTKCHGLDKVTSAAKNEAQWKVTIDRMVAKGAQLTPDEVQVLAAFLAGQ